MSAATKAIHAGCRQLGIDEDGRRAIYLRVVGKESQSDMTEAEKERIVAELRTLGFERRDARRPDGRLKLSGKYAPKLQALWIAGWNLGIFENRDDAALEAFVKRQTGLDAVRFCRDQADANKAIEALKAILARDGGVDWTVSQFRPPHTQNDGYRIGRAQWEKLYGLSGFIQEAHKIAGRPGNFSRELTREEYIVVMNELGKRIRAAKAGA
ncbi:Protein of unknown function [Ensifer adhaerens]|nr:Protein of unknown function [Ensifer adhaerens]